MTRKACFIFLLWSFFLLHKTYSQSRPVTISVFNNSAALPFSGKSGVLHTPLHPGVAVGTYFNLNKNEKNQLLQTAKVGYFYHRYAQHGIQLYTETTYRRHLGEAFSVDGAIGAGYFHAFPLQDIFELEDNTYKKKANTGKPRFMASLAIAPGYDFRIRETLPLRLFLQYQVWFQMPFVSNYVPVLPNTSLHLGVEFNI